MPDYQTPSTAVLCVGITTAFCMLLGDAILVPITEVGSVASAIGWSAACASLLALSRRHNATIRLAVLEKTIAAFALAIAVVMALMKLLPVVPGHFSGYEWIALAIWIALGTLVRLGGATRDSLAVESREGTGTTPVGP